MRRSIGAVLVAVALAPVGARSDEDGRIRIAAIVTTAKGEPLRGLRTRDFELRADGVAQDLESVRFTTAPTEAPRVFALVLDEFHVDSAAAPVARDALRRFTDTHLRPADLVIVLKPLDPLTALEPAPDRAHLHQVIASFEGRKGDYTPRTPFEERYMPTAPPAVAAARAQIVTAALRAAAVRLGEMAGVRGAIVFVSDGFARPRTRHESPADLQAVVRPAAAAGVPVHVLSTSAPSSEDADAQRAAAAARALAGQTGGEWTATAALDEALARISRDLDAHYVLTYRPTHGEDGRFHALEVDVNRPHARVRARSGYLAPVSAEMRAARAAARAPKPPPRPLRRSPLIQAWTGFTRNAEGRARVVLTWEPRRVPTGLVRRPTPRAIELTAATPDGEVLHQGRLVPVGAAHTADARDSAIFDAPAGRLLLDMKIVDGAGAVMDFDARDLDVPDLRKPGVIMLPVSVLRARSAREFRAVSADPDAPPVPSREFRRTDRLLVRVPAYDGRSAAMPITATLMNGWRQPMRSLPAMPGIVGEGITQFDLPLAPLAPGEYVIRITAPGAAEHVAFRITG